MPVARGRSALAALIASAPVAFVASAAHASNGYEFPDNGTEQLGRGGAWVARASNPLATFYNPAGLAGQRSGALLNLSLIWQKTCLRRTDPDGNAATLNGAAYRYPEEVCNTDSGTPFPNPQLAGVLQLSERLSIGVAVLGPSARGKFEYPATALGVGIAGTPSELPSPQRYLLMKDDLIYFWPQIGVGYEVADDLRIGASFIWGIARFKFTAVAASLADSGFGNDTFDQDFAADLEAKDMLVPGFAAGALWSASRSVDVGVWFNWMDAIRAAGDLRVEGPIYGSSGRPTSEVERSSTRATGDGVEVVAPWPMQARVGVRFHEAAKDIRDPIAADVWDFEIDLTWANNSVFDDLEVTLPSGVVLNVVDPQDPNRQVSFTMPTDASIPHHWKDAFGLRVGGDYAIVPDQIAVRAGAFLETEAQDPRYLHVDYVPSQKYGATVGATVRFGDLDAMLAYGHVFYKGLDNKGQGATPALAGSAPFRTTHVVNSGSNSSSVNVVSVGAAYSF